MPPSLTATTLVFTYPQVTPIPPGASHTVTSSQPPSTHTPLDRQTLLEASPPLEESRSRPSSPGAASILSFTHSDSQEVLPEDPELVSYKKKLELVCDTLQLPRPTGSHFLLAWDEATKEVDYDWTSELTPP